jgi:hypothetical protein
MIGQSGLLWYCREIRKTTGESDKSTSKREVSALENARNDVFGVVSGGLLPAEYPVRRRGHL